MTQSFTGALWSKFRCACFGTLGSQILSEPSSEEVTIHFPSFCHATAVMLPVWPSSEAICTDRVSLALAGPAKMTYRSGVATRLRLLVDIVNLDRLVPCGCDIPLIGADSQSIDLLAIRSKAFHKAEQGRKRRGALAKRPADGCTAVRPHRLRMLYRPTTDPAPGLPEADRIVIAAGAQSVRQSVYGSDALAQRSRSSSNLQYRHSRVSLRLLLLRLLLVMRVRARVMGGAAAGRYAGVPMPIHDYARHAGEWACRDGKELCRRMRR